MSKYWNKMEIFKGKKDNNLFISQKKPLFFARKDYELETSSKVKLNTDEIDKFYYFNYNVNEETSFTQLNSKKYLYLDSEILTIKKDNKIIGSIVSVIIPVKINTELDKNVKIPLSERGSLFGSENTLIFACSSFLVIDKKYRRKGYGIAMIQESLQILYKNGGLGAYFINNVPRGNNNIKLNIWYFDLAKMNNNNTNLIVERVKEESFNFYMSLVKDKKIAFIPSLNYWKKWVEVFPTYTVKKDDKLIGMFCFNNYNVRYPIKKSSLMKGNLLFCLGKQPETLESSIEKCKSYLNILEVYETGDLTSKLVRSLNGKTYEPKYINFFNTQIQLKASDFHCPLF